MPPHKFCGKITIKRMTGVNSLKLMQFVCQVSAALCAYVRKLVSPQQKAFKKEIDEKKSLKNSLLTCLCGQVCTL